MKKSGGKRYKSRFKLLLIVLISFIIVAFILFLINQTIPRDNNGLNSLSGNIIKPLFDLFGFNQVYSTATGVINPYCKYPDGRVRVCGPPTSGTGTCGTCIYPKPFCSDGTCYTNSCDGILEGNQCRSSILLPQSNSVCCNGRCYTGKNNCCDAIAKCNPKCTKATQIKDCTETGCCSSTNKCVASNTLGCKSNSECSCGMCTRGEFVITELESDGLKNIYVRNTIPNKEIKSTFTITNFDKDTKKYTLSSDKLKIDLNDLNFILGPLQSRIIHFSFVTKLEWEGEDILPIGVQFISDSDNTRINFYIYSVFYKNKGDPCLPGKCYPVPEKKCSTCTVTLNNLKYEGCCKGGDKGECDFCINNDKRCCATKCIEFCSDVTNTICNWNAPIISSGKLQDGKEFCETKNFYVKSNSKSCELARGLEYYLCKHISEVTTQDITLSKKCTADFNIDPSLLTSASVIYTFDPNTGGFLTLNMVGQGDYDQLLNNYLPHEVMHIVIATALKQPLIPRGLDEGLAMLHGSPEAQCHFFKMVKNFNPRIPAFELLSTLEFPENDVNNPDPSNKYYSQSQELVRYLIEMKLTNGICENQKRILLLLRYVTSEKSINGKPVYINGKLVLYNVNTKERWNQGLINFFGISLTTLETKWKEYYDSSWKARCNICTCKVG